MRKSLMNYGKRSEKVSENIDDNDKYFDFLNDVHEKSNMNMYAAPAVLMTKFDITKQQARALVADWMQKFDDPNYPPER